VVEQRRVCFQQPVLYPLGGFGTRQRRVEAEQGARDLKERLERFAGGVALSPVHLEALFGGLAEKLFGQTGLALAGRASDLNEPAIAREHFGEHSGQRPKLRFAADERRQSAPLAGGIARMDGGAAEYGQGRHRMPEPLQLQMLGRAGIEEIALRTERGLARQNMIGTATLAQPRRQNRRSAAQREPAAGLVLSRKHHLPGMDPAMNPGRHGTPALPIAERPNSIAELERRFDGALRIVLARMGNAEARKHFVALFIREAATMISDRPDEDGLQKLDQLRIFLFFQSLRDPR